MRLATVKFETTLQNYNSSRDQIAKEVRQVIGRTDNGKTAIFRRFRDMHFSVINAVGEVEYPAIAMQLPPNADDNMFSEELLKVMMQPYRNTKLKNNFKAVREALSDLRCKILLIDEIEHSMSAGYKKQRLFINMLKYLSNDLSLPIVAFGPEEALNVFSSDPQLDNRFKKILLPRWQLNNDFRRLLMSFEKMLPLKEASDLKDPTMAMKIFGRTNGTIGEITDVLKLAAIDAIKSKSERITTEIIDRIDFQSSGAVVSKKDL